MIAGNYLVFIKFRILNYNIKQTKDVYKRQVLDNILSNAAAHASCTVTLRLSLKQGALLAEVSDDGPGFSTAALEKGCDPFFTEARDNGHQGLGPVSYTHLNWRWDHAA